MNFVEDFRKAASDAGVPIVGQIIADAKFHRFSTGENGDKDGYYLLFEDGPPYCGIFGCWRRDIRVNWRSGNGTAPHGEDLAKLKRKWREAEAIREKEESARHVRMSQKAFTLIKSLPEPKSHPYLEAKGVGCHGLKINPDNELVVPLQDSDGVLWSYQTIDTTGDKLFMPGGKIRGCYHQIGNREGPIVVCEGYATGATIYESTGWDVACAMNCGNLQEVCKSIRKTNPGRLIIVAADDDRNTEGNPGKTKGLEAANSCRAKFVFPSFPDSYEGKGTDFNDLSSSSGKYAVREQLLAAAGYPIAIPIGELKIPSRDDPDELLKYRFLCRGGGMLLVGPTGIGKSSLVLQMLALFSNGLPAFGIEPTRPLRAIYIQAENDEGDVAEIRDGIVSGLEFTESQRKNFFERVIVHSENGHTSKSFFEKVVIPLIVSNPQIDLIVLDPALSYLGGEAKDQKAVGDFLRSMLAPILTKYRISSIVVHHANKPATGNQKSDWTTSEMAYLGSGSIEWANWSRAVIALQGTANHGVFKMHAAKRGTRLNWKDSTGEKSYHKLIKHHKSDGIICWLPAEEQDLESTSKEGGRPRKTELDDFVCLLTEKSLSSQEWIEASKSVLKISRSTFYRLLESSEKEGRIIRSKINGKWALVTSQNE